MEWRIIDEKSMPQDIDAEIRRRLCVAFPPDIAVYTHTRAWHDSHPAFTLVLLDGENVMAHVGVVDRTVTIGDAPFRSAGVQNVFVVPEQRGKGLGGEAVSRAMDEARRREYDIGLLFCKPALEKLYAGLGWLGLGDREILRVDSGAECPLPGKNLAMYLPLRRDAIPDGILHLRGNDW